MRKILVTGATGEIGVPLVEALRVKYGIQNVISGVHKKEPPAEIKLGPHTVVDVTNFNELEKVIKEHKITHIFHLSSILSGTGEKNPALAFEVNIKGLLNVLEASLKNGVKQIVYPSSIAAFGPETPRENTPNDTVQRPTTIYGMSKVIGEDLADVFSKYLKLDVRGVRFPGIISPKEKPPEPPNGTTDALPLMIWHAVMDGHYTCYLKSDTRLPMMYMPDAVNSLIQLSEAPFDKLQHHADFNVGGGKGLNVTPAELAEAIRKVIPNFKLDYDQSSELHKTRQKIADSWPKSLDDSIAKKEWNWRPEWDLDKMVKDMLKNLRIKLGKN